MTAIDVEVQVVPAPSIDVDVQFTDAPTIDVEVQIADPTFTVLSVLPTGPRGPAGVQGADGDMGPQGDPGQDGADGADGAPGVVQSIVEGTNITVDDTDPANPIVASTGGSGLPDPWTADQTSGEVTATTDGTDATALTVEAVAGQTEPLQVWKDESGIVVARLMQNGDLITYPGAGATGANMGVGDSAGDNVFCGFDYADSGVIRRGGLGLYAQTDDSSVRCQLTADAGLAPDGTGRIAEVAGNSANDGHIGGFQFRHDDEKSFATVSANAGQTAPLLYFKDENEVVVTRVLPSGAIGTSSGEPADADIVQGEMFVYRVPTLGDPVAGLKFRDENDDYWIAEIPMTLVP